MKQNYLTTTPLKKHLLFVVFLFTIFQINAQTTYTYSGSGDWSNTANWSPSYPGTTINPGDTVVIIDSHITFDTAITNSGTVNVGADSYIDNIAHFTNSGTLNMDGNFFSYYGTVANLETGTIILTGQTSSFEFRSGSINSGTITATSNDSSILFYDSSSNSGTITSNGWIRLRVSSTNSGTITSNGNLNIGVVTNTGTINNNGTAAVILYSFTFTNNGIFNNTGTFNNTGIFENNSVFDNTGTFVNSGTLTGVNTQHTSNFSNPGILSPGNSPGTYTFNNDYTHEATATLLTELESTSNYDKVFSGGNVTLNGTLDVSLLNGFTPSVGDSFTILTANSISGTFDTVNLPSGYDWNVSYTDTEVILRVTQTFTSLFEAYSASQTEGFSAGIYNFNVNGNLFSSYVDDEGFVLVASADLSEENDTSGYTQVSVMTLQSDDILSQTIVAALSPTELKLNSSSGVAINRTTTNQTMLTRFSNYEILSRVPGDGALWSGTGGAINFNNNVSAASLNMIIWHSSGASNNLHWFPNTNPEGSLQADGFSVSANDTEMNLWTRSTTNPTLSTIDFNLGEVNLYPNPANNSITISGLQNKENYTIYNTLGQEVKKGIALNNSKIDVQNLNNGLYFIKFGNRVTLKFTKK
ncbi:T9SS type A sorting domain-containing protein [Lacinutrix sp. C3R15]|uniref:T9SS type A sorting domain-containing protein n=1 Tax=Flavobacteriaceae TaxID=49546 RepID=UPI001C08BB93|nr:MULTISPECIES: T9SS type A sorting domain-containing protein [Flavobacteriaceae]MBU2940788.1 T9SS type A sorting domain-containing protein [Lacinutrix sp. C3R15]MDO6624106.1 T9SS type A sorting domain-containing protein [Oceanihabitans sp. 1_MG-2023]